MHKRKQPSPIGAKMSVKGEIMGLDYIEYAELPKDLKCKMCGSTHVKVRGARKLEYELEERFGQKIDDSPTNEVWNRVYSVECLDCGSFAKFDVISIQFGVQKG